MTTLYDITSDLDQPSVIPVAEGLLVLGVYVAPSVFASMTSYVATQVTTGTDQRGQAYTSIDAPTVVAERQYLPVITGLLFPKTDEPTLVVFRSVGEDKRGEKVACVSYFVTGPDGVIRVRWAQALAFLGATPPAARKRQVISLTPIS
jgi:hypothetical protein